MKWGVRKSDKDEDNEISVIRRDKPTPRKKKVTEGNGTGAHKRGEGQHYENGYGEEGVGPDNDYHNAINVYGAYDYGYAPVSTQLGKELKTAMLKEMLDTEEYKNILKLIEDIEKLAKERKKNWNQGSTASTMVFEEKANKLIQDINSNLSSLDSMYKDKTKLVKQTVDKTYSPSKDVLDFLSPSSSSLKIDKKSGRVSKGWKASPTVPKDKIGWKL